MLPLLAALAIADYRSEFPLPGPTVPQGWGVNIHFTHPQPGEMEMIRDAGFKWIRMDFGWAGIEREKGKYDFSAYDVLVDSLKKNGIRPLFILDYGNDLYQKGSPSTPEAREAFARFSAASVKHFQGIGALWEMWNEPNISFWQPQPNVDDYVKLALAVGKAIRQAAPQEWYIGPATSGIDLGFLEACFKGGLLEYWDAVSVHPYRNTPPETALNDWSRLRELTQRYDPKGKHVTLISGEWGYSEKYDGLNLDLQAKYAPRQYLVNLLAGVNLSIWYDWKDDGIDPKEIEHHFGTVYSDLKPKPTYLNMKALAHDLIGYSLNKQLFEIDRNHFKVLFTRGERTKVVRWNALPGSDTVPVVTDEKMPQAVVDWPALPGTIRASNSAALAKVLAWPKAPKGTVFAVSSAPVGKKVGKAIECAPDEASLRKGLASLARLNDPSSAVHLLKVELKAGGKTYSQAALWPPAHDYTVTLASPVPGALTATVGGPGGFPKVPAVLTAESGGKKADVLVKEGGVAVRGLAIGDAARVKATLKVGDAAVQFPAVSFSRIPTDSPTAWSWVSDGDPAIDAKLLLSADRPPPGLPFACSSALRLDYTFGAGWRFACLKPNARIVIPTGAETLTFWLYGDGSGDSIRLRFTDESGQTFQPSGPNVEWTGWRLVSLPLVPGSGGYWGGKNDGVQHGSAFLETAFLLDSTPARAHSGTVWIAGMSVSHRM